jgi:hypothetical protein
VASNFNVDTVAVSPPTPAVQQTTVRLCHDEHGLHFRSNATDYDVFNSATKCNDPVSHFGTDGSIFCCLCFF